MLRRIRLSMLILLLAGFVGCYTQLRGPREVSVEEPPPPAAEAVEGPVYWPTRVDVYFHDAFPMFPFTDPWYPPFYHPFHNRWVARIVLFDSYDPFRTSRWFLIDDFFMYEIWGGWYPMAISYRRPTFRRAPSPRHVPAPAHTVSPRPRIRRAGFSSDVPSAAAIRRLGGAGQTSSPVKAEPSKRRSQDQHGSTATPQVQSPSSSRKSGTQAQPAPKQKDKEETSKEEKREEKREGNRRRGGMN